MSDEKFGRVAAGTNVVTMVMGTTAYVIGHWVGFANLDRLGGDPAFATIRQTLAESLPHTFILILATAVIGCVVGIIGAYFGFMAVQGAATGSPSGGPPPFLIGALFMLAGFGFPFSTTSLFTTIAFGHYLGMDRMGKMIAEKFGLVLFLAPIATGLLFGVIMGRIAYGLASSTRQALAWDALETAINSGDLATVEELLGRGVNPGSKSPMKQPALLGAIIKGHTQIVELLISKGADINEPDTFGMTPLTIAIHKNNKVLVDVLLLKGADVDGRNGQLGGPLLLAAERGHYEVCQALLSRNVNVNVFPKQDHRTPLHWAAINRHSEVVRLLIGQGANVELIDGSGKKAADYLRFP